MKSDKYISVVLPTYNRLEVLKELILKSLENQLSQNFDLIVVDDASTDGTAQYFRSEKFKSDFPRLFAKTTCISNKRNIGSPSSRNVGFEAAKSKWVFMVEDDLEIRDNNFFSEAEIILRELTDKDIVVVSPKREEFIDGYYKNYNNKLANFGRISKEIYVDPSLEYSDFVETTHACSFILTEIANMFKYDVENYAYFREESDFYMRISRAGYKLFYVGDRIKTYHRMDKVSSGGNRKHSSSIKNEMKYIRSHFTFLKKYFNLPRVRLFFFFVFRETKNVCNILGLKSVKNILSFLRL